MSELKLPWSVDAGDESKIEDCDGFFVAGIFGANCSLEEDDDRAALIVKAVNSHDAFMRIAEMIGRLDETEGLTPIALSTLKDMVSKAANGSAA